MPGAKQLTAYTPDWICNWVGNLAAANAISYSGTQQFNGASTQSYRVQGVSKGEYKAAGNLSWLKVFGAGHEVPFYRESSRSPSWVRHENGVADHS